VTWEWRPIKRMPLVVLLVLTPVLTSCVGRGSQSGTSTTAVSLTVTTTSQPVTTSGASTTTTSPSPGSVLVLRNDGMGVVTFGQSVGEVIPVLTPLLGPPDWEETQQSADIDLSVQWGESGEEFLYLQFTTLDHFDVAPELRGQMAVGPVFHYYLTRSNLLATEAGITVGSTVGELSSAHPEVQFTYGSCDGDEWEFVLDPPDGWPELPMWGLLDGDPGRPTTRIEYVGAGWDRSPC
jgi:hypothetical protein